MNLRHTFLVTLMLGLPKRSFGEDKSNNVCPTFEDYYTIKNNSRCWYDFSAEFDCPTVIRLNGYPVIEYRVPTSDGFILTMFRIPPKKSTAPKYPVYLQHGLSSTSDYFVSIKRNSLAFVLADAGFDVWLGNYRGTRYSQTHQNLTVFDPEYWDHSMDDIITYDYPALFSTILSNTNSNGKIVYIGHSLGTTLGLMYTAEYPDIAKNNLQMMIFMSPAYTLTNMKAPYKLIAPFGPAIMNIAQELKLLRILSQEAITSGVFRVVCLESPPLMQLCMQLNNLFWGPNTQFTADLIPTYFNHIPGGTSLKILNHAADLVLGNFRKYNYIEDNYKYYGRLTPPVYDIKKMQVPVYIYYSTQDWATTELDALNLWQQLPKAAQLGIRRIDLPAFNHLDFVYSRNAKNIVYDELVQVINKFIKSYICIISKFKTKETEF
ncbi:hypothetical protein Zmor_010893 [Zophobas morio]|uniref:Lipase n=1 Tax=Zophobas morio TaxID=2755281 RepID=A0AA38IPZ4_9CUCU|nr:hypothetical protein Zmor_010893 [Zophobas morio]